MSTDPAAASGRPADRDGPRLRAVVEEYEDEPDECTIFPLETRGDDRMTTWISAKSPNFVSLSDMR